MFFFFFFFGEAYFVLNNNKTPFRNLFSKRIPWQQLSFKIHVKGISPNFENNNKP